MTSGLRPYRSHKSPACDICRSRKIRCHVDVAGEPCRFCRERGTNCYYSSAQAASLKNTRIQHAKRRGSSTAPSVALQHSDHGLVDFPSVAGTSPTETSLLMNPTMAEDIDVLEKYLTSSALTSTPARKPYSVMPNASGKPIVYLTVPRRRKGLHLALDPGQAQREVLDQILQPLQSEVINIYFQTLHPCFPIVDKKTFLDLWEREPGLISSTLVCDIYALGILYWNKSEVLKHRTRPDLEFAWNQAVKALHDDFMAPSISTVHSALLDMVGRPILQISGNIVNAGRTVTLAHSLGLHRDVSGWKVTDHEKQVRMNLWWGCLIHDHWWSLAHGTPPNIQRANYDVPVPALALLLATSSISEDQVRASMSFINLCSLTQVLGGLLPLVYSLQFDEDEAWKTIRRIEYTLDEWETSLPDHLKEGSGSDIDFANGSSNLWFCYLSVQLLLCRVTFKMTATSSRTPMPEATQYRLALLRSSASKLIDFVIALHEMQLSEFWLPQTALLLVSAATILLRCIVESADVETKRDCACRLTKFQNRLEAARASGWDLAGFCLERCAQPIESIATAVKLSTNTGGHLSGSLHQATADLGTYHQALDRSMDISSSLDFSLPPDSLDFPWETVWETFDGTLPSPI